jgi:hypothetical protein
MAYIGRALNRFLAPGATAPSLPTAYSTPNEISVKVFIRRLPPRLQMVAAPDLRPIRQNKVLKTANRCAIMKSQR